MSISNCSQYSDKYLPTPVVPSSASTSTITELMALIPHDLRYVWYW